MKTCHKGKLSNRNVGSKDQGALTKIYAKFMSMPYACKEHIQVYVVAQIGIWWAEKIEDWSHSTRISLTIQNMMPNLKALRYVIAKVQTI